MLPTRELRISADLSNASKISGSRSGAASLTWYSGETVRIVASAQDGRFPLSVADGMSVRMVAWSGSDLETLYIDRPGTIITQLGGMLSVDIAPEYSALPVGAYSFLIRVYDAEGTDLGVSHAGILQVLPNPASDAVFAGPFKAVDWEEITSYANTATHGPHSPGQGIAFGTPDPTTGRVPIIVDATASEIPNTPAGNIAATDVQAAINELDGEKQSASWTAMLMRADGTTQTFLAAENTDASRGAAFAAAIAAATQVQADTVFLRRGVYHPENTVVFPSDLVLIGQGFRETIVGNATGTVKGFNVTVTDQEVGPEEDDSGNLFGVSSAGRVNAIEDVNLWFEGDLKGNVHARPTEIGGGITVSGPGNHYLIFSANGVCISADFTDNAGTAFDIRGDLSLPDLTPSQPTALDENGIMVSLPAADFRALIDAKQNAIVQNGNVTATNDALYHNVGNSVYTDPTVPAEGRGYTVVIVNGTATINSIGYAVAGTVIRRMWHSGAWQTARVYLPPGKSITESGTTRTIGRGDVGQMIRLTNAGACTITVPANSTTAFEDGDTVYFRVTTVSPSALTLGTDVVVNNAAAVTSLPAESSFALRRTATVNVWDLV
jgi:hypothetical protein